MEEKLIILKDRLRQLADLNYTQAVLGWDMQVNMPPGGSEDRGEMLATLGLLVHERFITDENARLLEELQPYADQLDPDSDDARIIKVTRRMYEKATRTPPRHIAEFARAAVVGQTAWEDAKTKSDFSIFQPHLEHLVELRQEYASFFAPYDHVYDPLLDDFEPGLKTADVQSIFAVLRKEQVALIKAISSRPAPQDDFLNLEFPEQAQWDFGVDVISRFGYDWNHGRQDKSVHPFTSSLGFGDVRITTRINSRRMATALFGTMHECGHALYELGYNPTYRRLPLGGPASLAIHESQSRLWENLVGRSRPFWTFFYPRLQQAFSSQLGNVSLDMFYAAVNKVSPSLIRVEADEATYNLHIMLRLELEIAMLEGTLKVKDLPAAWDARFQEYLGLTPPNAANGVLQDVHWSGGMLGYFPTYALGNLVSAQLWEVINRDLPGLSDQIAKGEFGGLLDWLRKHVHVFGAKFEPQELVQKITGDKIDPQPYLRYLHTKYGEIYHL